MGVLEFILYLLIALIMGFITLCCVAVKHDTTQLEKENEKLRRDLHNARKRKIEREYKNAKKIKEDK